MPGRPGNGSTEPAPSTRRTSAVFATNSTGGHVPVSATGTSVSHRDALASPRGSTLNDSARSGGDDVGGGGASLRNVSIGSPTVPTGPSTAARLWRNAG